MRKTTKRLKQFCTLALSAALAVQVPLTAFAASVEETIEVTDTEQEQLPTEESNIESEVSAEETTEEKNSYLDIDNEENIVPETENDVQTKTISDIPEKETVSESAQEETTEAASTEQEEASTEEQTETNESAAELRVSSNADFTIQNGVLTGYAGTDTDVVIPEGVVTIGANAFKNNTVIKTVRFSASVVAVEQSAFENCGNLSSVTMNEGLETIGVYAFRGAAFGEKSENTGAVTYGTLTIPSTVQSIGQGAFNSCSYLKTVIFANGDTADLTMSGIFYYSSSGIFGLCPNLTKVVLPDRLQTIQEYSFYNCGKLEEVTFGNQLETIGAYAFDNCVSLKGINLPETVKEIGICAFRNCSRLKTVELNEGLNIIGENAFKGAAFGEKSEDTGAVTYGTLTVPSTVQSIGQGAFNGCAYLQTVTFENGENEVLEIDSSKLSDCTFGNCANLTKVELPERLKTIQESTFYNCGKLKEVTFGNRLETIGESAFDNCADLERINLPAAVKEIGACAFRNCSRLKTAELNEGLKTIGEYAFEGAAFGEKSEDTGAVTYGTLTVPSTVQSIGQGAFNKCEYLKTVIFANGETADLTMSVLLPASGTFGECPSLTKVELPERLKTIEQYTFYNCKNLKEVTFGNQLEIIGAYAFDNCACLEGINLPLTVKEIGKYAFRNCSRLKTAELNEGLKTIGEYAFEGAAFGGELEDTGAVTYGTLTVPSTVQSIGQGAFNKCEYLKTVIFANGDTVDITIQSGVTGFTSGTFGECSNLTKVQLPDRLKTIEKYTFFGCKNLKEVTFGNKLETIGAYAFCNCACLEGINLPSTVKEIGEYAFRNCSRLKTAELNEGLKTIGEYAFEGAAFGEKSEDTGAVTYGTLTVPGTVQSIGQGAFNSCEYLKTVVFANGDTVVLTISSQSSFETFGYCPNLTTVILPERITKLNAYTFASDANLQTLYIPETVTEIADNTVSKCPNLTIYGVKGSAAETYAKKNNIPFKDKSELDADMEVQSVNISPDTIEEVGEDVIGKQIQLYAEVLPAIAQNKKVTYMSDNEEVAAVDAKGLVTIKGYGTAAITVITDEGGKTAQCKVTVSKEPIDERPQINSVLFPKSAASYSAIYTGEQIRPIMIVSYQYTDDSGKAKTQKLKLNVDYTVRYSNNVNASRENSPAKVTVRGIGEYTGEITKEFTIKPKSISSVTLSPVGDIVFGQTPSVVVTDGAKELKAETDYTVRLSTTGAAGADTLSVLTVEGVGNYTGSSKKSAKFNILKEGTQVQSIASPQIRVEFKKFPAKGYTYSGKAQKPGVIVTDTSTGKKLSSSMYKVIYADNINAGKGTAKAWVVGVSKNGKGYYGISAPLSFDINQKDFGKISASLKGTIPKAGNIETIKNAIDEAITVKDGKHILSDAEYTVDYGEINTVEDIQIGIKYPITLTPKADGNYVVGSRKIIYIKFGQLNLASKTAKLSVQITDVSKGEVIVRYNGIALVKDRDYTAVVTKDKNKDTYTVKIKSVKGSAYKGSRTVKNLTIKN